MEGEYFSKNLDHLGIVAAMCDEIDLIGTIDRLIPPDPRAVLTTGECVKLMVINGLGFTSRPLYLEAQFYDGKPIERLLGRACKSAEISDDRLGRALDRCYDAGCDTMFTSIASKAAIKYKVDRTFQRLDITSMEVDGEYVEEDQKKEIKALGLKEFDCEYDAKQELNGMEKRFKRHKIDEIQIIEKRVKSGLGRPKKTDLPLIKYKITAKLVEDGSKIAYALEGKGKFIIATNELDDKKLSADALLGNYKGQQSVERGFRFLKDPLFMTSSVFLKKDTRINALGMVMCLCLLVYTLAQRYSRQKLVESSEMVLNQLGKPTNRPTMRWVFQIFEGVHLLIHHTAEGLREIVLNLNPTRRHILQVLGPPFEKIYRSAA